MEPSSGRAQEVSLMSEVVKGLAQQPSYLLWFGIATLVFGLGSSAGLVGALMKNPNLGWGGVIIAVLALGLTAVVIVKVQHIGSDLPAGAVGDKELEPIFSAIHVNVREALRVQHPVFHDWLSKECSLFRTQSRQWAHGEIEVDRRRYNELLVEVYGRAEGGVFATSTQDYFPIWKAQAGKSLMNAHEKSKSAVERVFLFESLGDVNSDHVNVMRQQAASGRVKVFVYGVLEHEAYEIPKGISSNFAYIDGGSVIITTSSSSTETKGTFYFKDANQVATYNDVIENIRDGWISLEEFLGQRPEFAGHAEPQVHLDAEPQNPNAAPGRPTH